MNLSDYDNALKSKLKLVFDNVVNSSNEKALQYSEDNKAEVKLPLISFWRINNNYSTEDYSAPLVVSNRRGRIIKELDNSSRLVYKEIPINLQYQIDLWSDRRHEVDILFEEVLFYLSEEPHIEVPELNIDFPMKFTIQIVDTDTDVDLTTFDDNGDLFRQIITIKILNARLVKPVEGKPVKAIDIRTVIIGGEDDVEN